MMGYKLQSIKSKVFSYSIYFTSATLMFFVVVLVGSYFIASDLNKTTIKCTRNKA